MSRLNALATRNVKRDKRLEFESPDLQAIIYLAVQLHVADSTGSKLRMHAF